MAWRSTVLLLAAFGWLSGISAVRAQEGLAPVGDRAAITDQLIARTSDSYAANLAVVKANPELAFEIVRDNWKNLTEVESKQKLIFAFVNGGNPHLLEILDLGVNDSGASVQYLAYDLLHNFAFRNFVVDPAAYPAWHAGVKGKPLTEVITSGCRTLVEQYVRAGEAERAPLLDILTRLEFGGTDRLAKLRRDTAIEAGLLTGLEKAMAPPGFFNTGLEAVGHSFQLLRNLEPDEAFMKRVLVPLTTKNGPSHIRRQAASMIGTLKSLWAADLLFALTIDDPSRAERMTYTSILSGASDPHLIPKLIALMEADDSPRTEQMIGFAVSRLTGNFSDGPHDGAWWHGWWERNKARFPADVRAVPYPKIRTHRTPGTKVFSIARGAERRLVANDPQRAYWLLSPAYVGPAAAEDPGAAPPPKPKFGLIVALTDGAGSGSEPTEFWQEAIQKSLKDGYFVAVPAAPKWNAHQPATWITRQNKAQVTEARFTTESFLNDIIKDVSERYPIDSSRLILHGVGEGGLAAYACSLDVTTPFRGFYLLSSPFKTAQLPPLTRARGRRYLIQQSKDDKLAPYFQAAAAEDLLRKQSALVKLMVVKGQHGYKFSEKPWEQVSQAITWLETPR
jgi:predicted esterase